MSNNNSPKDNSQIINHARILEILHRNWQPHPSQLEVGKVIINNPDIDTVFLQCGRKYGKTEFAMYILHRWANLYPNSPCYYVTTTKVHGRTLVWNDPRIRRFSPKELLSDNPENGNEMILRFKNGSFIQILGSENFTVANGLRPAIMVYDEFCEFHPSFHETMQPNRMVYKCPLLVIGTPPRQDSGNTKQYEDLAEFSKTAPNCAHFIKTTFENPFIDHEMVKRERETLFAKGEEHLWYSQYEAKIVKGGQRVIFPMFSEADHIFKHEILHEHVLKDASNLDWYCIADPGSTTVFGTLFAAINNYTKEIYILDEIYATNQKDTSTGIICPQMLTMSQELYPRSSFEDDWFKGYDEAAAWFHTEVVARYGWGFLQTIKAQNKKENGISLLKDCFLNYTIKISDRCENLKNELNKYVCDADGKYPKHGDHLIDCLRYLLGFANYTVEDVVEAKPTIGKKTVYQRATQPTNEWDEAAFNTGASWDEAMRHWK